MMAQIAHAATTVVNFKQDGFWFQYSKRKKPNYPIYATIETMFVKYLNYVQ